MPTHPHRTLMVRAGLSLTGVIAVASAFAAIYQLTVTGISYQPSFWDLFHWQFAAWAFWIPTAPAIITLSERLSRSDHALWKRSLMHAGACSGIVAAHAVWFGLASDTLSPYVSLREFMSGLTNYLRGSALLDLALYGALFAATSRLLVARALAESERTFRSVFENAVVGIFRSTPDGRFLMLNQSAAEALGYPSADEAIAGVADIANELYVAPEERAAFLDRIRVEGRVSDYPCRMRRRDGSVNWYVENARGVFDDDDTLLFIEGTVRDVTTEVATRQELRESERRSSELRMLLSEAKLQALRLQIRPHFLFNVLNTVAMLIRTGQTSKAQRTLALLGEMFRYSLELDSRETVRLEQELASIDRYLDLEQLRFEDRLKVEREIDRSTLNVHVPVLILQPIIENAIKYGVAGCSDSCTIALSVARTNDRLSITVTNSVRDDGHVSSGHGIGLRNVRARLAECYDGEASFEFRRDAGTARTILQIPIDQE